jgi:hypothetical protein
MNNGHLFINKKKNFFKVKWVCRFHLHKTLGGSYDIESLEIFGT